VGVVQHVLDACVAHDLEGIVAKPVDGQQPKL
jgi:hypothetical protein